MHEIMLLIDIGLVMSYPVDSISRAVLVIKVKLEVLLHIAIRCRWGGRCYKIALGDDPYQHEVVGKSTGLRFKSQLCT